MVQQLAAMFLGGASPADPLANPLRADLTGLPPVLLTAGSHEGLVDNVERFAALAEKAAVDVTVEIAAEMQHVYPIMAGRAPEADETIARVGAWLAPKLGLPAA